MTDISGYIEGGEHHLPVRIYYEDTDFSGLVYHANYLKYFERGRSEYMRLIGIHHHELADLPDPLAFAVSSLNLRYRQPARIDQLVWVRSRLVGVQGASFKLRQRVMREDQILTEAEVQVVCIDMKGRPRRLPPHLQSAIAACVINEKDD
jgi:acyl-CoA thioester hydrolase